MFELTAGKFVGSVSKATHLLHMLPVSALHSRNIFQDIHKCARFGLLQDDGFDACCCTI